MGGGSAEAPEDEEEDSPEAPFLFEPSGSHDKLKSLSKSPSANKQKNHPFKNE